MKTSFSLVLIFFLFLSPAAGWSQETADEWFQKGIEALKAREYDAAIESFRESVSRRPDHEASYRHMGLAYIVRGMWDEGIAAYRKAIEINPENPQTHYDLGFSLYKTEAYKEAVQEFKKTIALDAGFVAAYQALGALYAENKTLDKAIPEFKKALELSPGDPAVHWNLAEAYSESGNDILAADHYYHVGVLSLVRGDREAALSAYEKALPLTPEIARMLLQRLYPEDYMITAGRSASESKKYKKGKLDGSDGSSIVIGPFPSKMTQPWYRIKETMNVRSEPSTNSEIVGQLKAGEEFQILEEAAGNDSTTSWYRVEVESGLQGWLCGIYKGVVQYERVSES